MQCLHLCEADVIFVALVSISQKFFVLRTACMQLVWQRILAMQPEGLWFESACSHCIVISDKFTHNCPALNVHSQSHNNNNWTMPILFCIRGLWINFGPCFQTTARLGSSASSSRRSSDDSMEDVRDLRVCQEILQLLFSLPVKYSWI